MISTSKKTTPAVAYYRMSSGKQEKSIPAQRSEVERFAEKNGYRIVRWKPYVDKGISGDESEKRLGFQRLMSDAQDKGDFEVVLCWDQDRFSRFDPMEANHYWYLLREAGVRIVTVAQGELNLDELGGWITASVNQYGKQQYLRDLSRNVTRGRKAAAQAGKWQGGKPPYGYAAENQRLVPGELEKVERLQWLFDRYANTDTSLWALADELNTSGVPGPGGGVWHNSVIHTLLSNPVYCGDLVWNRRRRGKHHRVQDGDVVAVNGSDSSWRNDRADWIVVADTHEPLVDRKAFERVQKKLASRRKRTTPIRGGGDFVLSGLLRCGHCGKNLQGSDYHSGGKYHYRKYRCGSYRTLGKSACGFNSVHESQMLDALVRLIQTKALAPENFERLKAEVKRQAKQRVKAPSDATRQLRKRVKAIDRQIDQATDRLLKAPDDLMDLLAPKVQELRRQRDALQAQLEAAENSSDAASQGPVKLAEQAIAELWQLREGLENNDPAVVREVLRQLIDHVELWFTPVKKPKQTEWRFKKGLIHLKNKGEACPTRFGEEGAGSTASVDFVARAGRTRPLRGTRLLPTHGRGQVAASV